ncbi:MAG: hypothetical protein QOH71_3279 [Blastocatellia bacterium]|nr:hypothetical protein [Blastocatellia bacterium]
MTDQIVRLLNSLGIVASDYQGEVAQRGDRAPIAAQQTYDSYSLPARLLTSHHYIRRSSRGRDRQAYVTFRSQRLDLPGKDVFESAVVSNAGKHASVGRQRDRRQRSPGLQEPVNQLAGDMLRIRGRPAVAKHQELSICPESIRD